MSRPISATIHLDAIVHNYLLAKRCAPRAKAWAVVKADAYGHGLLRCALALKEHADGFALLGAENAVQLREAGLTQPILLLEGVFSADELITASVRECAIVVHNEVQLRMLELSELPAPVSVFLKINTGMNRLGFAPEQAQSAAQRLQQCENVRDITLMTHFAQADGEGVAQQMASFKALAGDLPFKQTAANSAALLRFPETHLDWVRPGLMLYGGSPIPDLASAEKLELQPAMTFCSQVLSVQNIQRGEKVGYGGTFTADKPMRIGVVACGYADGYPRHAPTGTPILVAGARTRTLGRVSMDMLACDLTDLPQAGVGSPVVLWGRGLPADEVAQAAGTLSYELFCAVAPRVPVLSV